MGGYLAYRRRRLPPLFLGGYPKRFKPNFETLKVGDRIEVNYENKGTWYPARYNGPGGPVNDKNKIGDIISVYQGRLQGRDKWRKAEIDKIYKSIVNKRDLVHAVAVKYSATSSSRYEVSVGKTAV